VDRPSLTSLSEQLADITKVFVTITKPPSPLVAAKVDGITDDITAINACVDYLVSKGGGVLFFPYGTTLVSSNVKIRDNITYQGTGWGSIIKAHASSKDNVMGHFGPDYDFDIQNPVIRDLCVDGNSSNVSYNTYNAGATDDAYQNGIRMHRWKNALIENVRVQNATFNGISCYNGCHGSKIINNYVSNIGKSTDPANGYYSYNGIFLEWFGDNIEISDNIVTECRQVGIVAQIADTGGMAKVGIRRNRVFLTQSEGILVRDQSANCTGILDDFWIEDNLVQQSCLGNTTAGIRVERNTPGKWAFDFKVKGNKVKDSSFIGILINTGCLSTIVSHNSVYGSVNKGIIDAGTDTEINGCVSLNNTGVNLDISSGVRTRLIGGQFVPNGNDGQSGSFTPTVLKGGTSDCVYSSRLGSYRVNGNRVEFNLSIVLTSKGTATGNLTVSGLPFMSKNTGAFSSPKVNVAAVTFVGSPFGLILNNDNKITLFTQQSGISSTPLTDSALANNSEFYISGSYEI
jgi:hypothetical protein